MKDRFNLQRFVNAQDSDGAHDRAIAELRQGRKTSHWMWFVFPQIAGLGKSAMSELYAIRSVDEAIAYLQHPVPGTRLLEAATVVVDTTGSTAERIFGSTDAKKLQSSMTLFLRAGPAEPVFSKVLGLYFDSHAHLQTDRLIGAR